MTHLQKRAQLGRWPCTAGTYLPPAGWCECVYVCASTIQHAWPQRDAAGCYIIAELGAVAGSSPQFQFFPLARALLPGREFAEPHVACLLASRSLVESSTASCFFSSLACLQAWLAMRDCKKRVSYPSFIHFFSSLLLAAAVVIVVVVWFILIGIDSL